MKVFNVVVKIVLALTAVAGAVYLAATYGDKIVAWAKNLLAKCRCCCECECDGECECECECACEEVAEEAPIEEVVINETEPVAEAADFEA